MKKLIFGIIATVLLTLNLNAQTNKGSGGHWPYGCRTWTVGINIGIASFTSEVTLCCVATNWTNPPISCTEVTTKNSSGTEAVYQYIMVDELEKNIGKEIKESEIVVYSEQPIEYNDEKFYLKKDAYLIELNDKKERFIKVVFEKNN